MPQASWVGRNGALTFRCNIISSISWFRWLSLSTGCLTTQIEFCPPLCFDASEVRKFNLGLPLASNRRCTGSPMCALAYLHQCYCICAPIQLYLCTNAIVFVHQGNCISAPTKLYLWHFRIVGAHLHMLSWPGCREQVAMQVLTGAFPLAAGPIQLSASCWTSI